MLLSQLDPQAWDWLDEEQVRAPTAAWLRDQDERCRDSAWAARFRHHCPVPGRVDTDYAQRWVPVGEHWLLAGIRMRGADVAHPFVDLVATSGPIDMADAVHAAMEAYAPFRPHRARVRGPAQPEHPALAVSVDQHLYAAPTTTVRDGPCQVTLQPIRDVEAAVAYVRATHAAWTEQRPWIPAHLQVVSEEQLQDAQNAGTAGWIHRGNGERVGLIAAQHRVDREWTAHVVLEEVVAPEHAGHGYAAQAQRALATRIDGVLAGTIDGINAASRRTAEAVGRMVVGGFYWVTPTR